MGKIITILISIGISCGAVYLLTLKAITLPEKMISCILLFAIASVLLVFGLGNDKDKEKKGGKNG